MGHIKNFFVPHSGNNYKPHLLHPKRAVFYAVVFAAMKAIVVVFALLVPSEAFLIPEVLTNEANRIIELTNQVRRDQNKSRLAVSTVLNTSADAKARDMVTNDYFSHQGPNQHGLAYFLKGAGYKYRVAGENLAMGFSDAESVVDAWIKSPTHYANLVDDDYKDIGVGIEAGFYHGRPTVYVAQHFGQLQGARQSLLPGNAPSVGAAMHSGAGVIAGEKIFAATSSAGSIRFDENKSRVFWIPVESGTRLVVRAKIDGTVNKAVALVAGYSIDLQRAQTGLYAGEIVVHETPNQIFDPVVIPTISIYGADGSELHNNIDWSSIFVSGQSPVKKYLLAKQTLTPITNIFSVSRALYWGFFGVFTVALLINIFVEIRKQHYHIIFSTLLVLSFLGWLLWV